MTIEELKKIAFLTVINLKISHNKIIIEELKNTLKSITDNDQSDQVVEKLINHLMIDKTLNKMIHE